MASVLRSNGVDIGESDALHRLNTGVEVGDSICSIFLKEFPAEGESNTQDLVEEGEIEEVDSALLCGVATGDSNCPLLGEGVVEDESRRSDRLDPGVETGVELADSDRSSSLVRSVGEVTACRRNAAVLMGVSMALKSRRFSPKATVVRLKFFNGSDGELSPG